jgi:hypothetical protein
VLDNKVVSVLRAQAASVAPAIQKILPTFPSSKVLRSSVSRAAVQQCLCRCCAMPVARALQPAAGGVCALHCLTSCRRCSFIVMFFPRRMSPRYILTFFIHM